MTSPEEQDDLHGIARSIDSLFGDSDDDSGAEDSEGAEPSDEPTEEATPPAATESVREADPLMDVEVISNQPHNPLE